MLCYSSYYMELSEEAIMVYLHYAHSGGGSLSGYEKPLI